MVWLAEILAEKDCVLVSVAGTGRSPPRALCLGVVLGGVGGVQGVEGGGWEGTACVVAAGRGSVSQVQALGPPTHGRRNLFPHLLADAVRPEIFRRPFVPGSSGRASDTAVLVLWYLR